MRIEFFRGWSLKNLTLGESQYYFLPYQVVLPTLISSFVYNQ